MPIAPATSQTITITCLDNGGTLVKRNVSMKGLSPGARRLLDKHPDFAESLRLRSHRTNAQILADSTDNKGLKSLRASYGDDFMERKPLLQYSIPRMNAKEEAAAYVERVALDIEGRGLPQWEV